MLNREYEDDLREGRLEEQLACAADLVNRWAREVGVPECADPNRGLNLRATIDALWMMLTVKEENLKQALDEHERFHQKVGCPGRPECRVCELEWA